MFADQLTYDKKTTVYSKYDQDQTEMFDQLWHFQREEPIRPKHIKNDTQSRKLIAKIDDMENSGFSIDKYDMNRLEGMSNNGNNNALNLNNLNSIISNVSLYQILIFVIVLFVVYVVRTFSHIQSSLDKINVYLDVINKK